MAMKIFALFLAALIATAHTQGPSNAADIAGAGCSVSASTSPQQEESWMTGEGDWGSQYSVSVTNTGRCPVSTLELFFQLPSNSNIVSISQCLSYSSLSAITSSLPSTLSSTLSPLFLPLICGQTDSWDLTVGPSYYLLNLYDTVLAVGASASAGFIARVPTQSPPPIPVTTLALCPRSCMEVAPSTQPTQQATVTPTRTPTRKPTGAPTSSPTASPTSSPTTPPTSPPTNTPRPSTSSTSSSSTMFPPGTCNVTLTIFPTFTWTQDGYQTSSSSSPSPSPSSSSSSSYAIRLHNNGPCSLHRGIIYYDIQGGVELASWNLRRTGSTRGGYYVEGFGDTLAAGRTYEGAGLVVKGGSGKVTGSFFGPLSDCPC